MIDEYEYEEYIEDFAEIHKEDLKTYLRCNRTSTIKPNHRIVWVCARLPHEHGKCAFIDRSGAVLVEWAEGYAPVKKHRTGII